MKNYLVGLLLFIATFTFLTTPSVVSAQSLYNASYTAVNTATNAPVSGTTFLAGGSYKITVTGGQPNAQVSFVTSVQKPGVAAFQNGTNNIGYTNASGGGIFTVNTTSGDVGSWLNLLTINGIPVGNYLTYTVTASASAPAPSAVPAPVPVAQTLKITSPTVGQVWTLGQPGKFEWTTTGHDVNTTGYIELSSNTFGTYRIANITNSGTYSWVPSGISAGVYTVRVGIGSSVVTVANVTFGSVPTPTPAPTPAVTPTPTQTPTYTPSFTYINTKNNQSIIGGTMTVGETWKFNVTGAKPNALVTVNTTQTKFDGTAGPGTGVATLGYTNSSGSAEFTGTTSAVDAGSWVESLRVDGVQVGSQFSFIVSLPIGGVATTPVVPARLPVINFISPSQGLNTGTITISGSNFLEPTIDFYNSTGQKATSFRLPNFESATSDILKFKPYDLVPGLYQVKVVTPVGTSNVVYFIVTSPLGQTTTPPTQVKPLSTNTPDTQTQATIQDLMEKIRVLQGQVSQKQPSINTQTQSQTPTESNNLTDDVQVVNQRCVALTYDLSHRSKDVSTNGEVSTLQDFLQSGGYLNSEPTGYFGLLTVNAVKKFQTASGVRPTGYVGGLTRAKIKSVSCQ